MLSNTLNTNEIKDRLGAEVEFQHLDAEGRTRMFAQVNEPPAYPYRLSIKHQETGSGLKLRRRSMVRIDKTVLSTIDNETPVTCSCYVVSDSPVGALAANTEMANVIANILSFCATTGAGTTVLFDCSGNGASALLNGSL